MSRGIDDAGSLGMEDFFLFFLFCQAFVLVEFLLRDVTIEHVARGGFTWCSFDLDFFRLDLVEVFWLVEWTKAILFYFCQFDNEFGKYSWKIFLIYFGLI